MWVPGEEVNRAADELGHGFGSRAAKLKHRRECGDFDIVESSLLTDITDQLGFKQLSEQIISGFGAALLD
jgi:hypothetical protein